jgi:serine/threonine-protein kinase
MAPGTNLPQVFGKYTLLSHLATGGMAEVYLAKQRGPSGFEKELVIKRILPHLAADPSFVQMFLAEATLAARVNHPNIAHIYELGDHEGDYYIAMEHVPGITLEKLLEYTASTGQPGLPWPIAVRIIASAAEGLDHAHKARDGEGRPLQLVHRDVSPSNIMVSWEGVTKILDFGIAKSDAQGEAGGRVVTGVGVLKGKLPYMSPEQLQGLELDARSDIFSLGSVLYELICGQRPFPGDAMGQLTVQILSREPISPEVLTPSFPADLKPILWRALSKSVNDRYQSARDLKQDLEQFLADQHVSCSNYDIEAYLRELVPIDDRATLTTPRVDPLASTMSSAPSLPQPGTTLPPGSADGAYSASQRDSSMNTTKAKDQAASPDEKSGRLGPLTLHGLDIDAEERRQKRDKGGSSVVTLVIAVLVLITGAVFYVLHERAVDHDKQPVARPNDSITAPPTATPPPATPPTPAATAPATAPATAATTPTAPAAKDTKAEKPAAKDVAKDDKAAAKDDKPATKDDKAGDGEAKKHRVHHKAAEDAPSEAPKALPRLPTPPPEE